MGSCGSSGGSLGRCRLWKGWWLILDGQDFVGLEHEAHVRAELLHVVRVERQAVLALEVLADLVDVQLRAVLRVAAAKELQSRCAAR